ncbi:hypothetical protein DM2_2348 [Halorubrum sp. DM2]|nr:hypothetical protein DM2_2348 [Halorubrum sp. DM2]
MIILRKRLKDQILLGLRRHFVHLQVIFKIEQAVFREFDIKVELVITLIRVITPSE